MRSAKKEPPGVVIPAQAGIQKRLNKWIPACAGMTTPGGAVMTTAGGSLKPGPQRGNGPGLGLAADAKLL